MGKEQDKFNDPNRQADEVVDKHVEKDIVRHVNCGCPQCMRMAQQLANDFMHGVDAQWIHDILEEDE